MKETRTFGPKEITIVQTEHSISYLSNGRTENWSNFFTPFDWLTDYADRNNIVRKVLHKPMDNFVNGKTKPYIQLTFKSKRQLQIFRRRGNSLFPYVEFV